MQNEFGGVTAAFVAMSEARQTAQPKERNNTNINRKEVAHIEK